MERWSFSLLLGILLLLAGTAAASLLWGTSIYGIGISSDTVSYVRAERNLLQGYGLGRVSYDGTFKPLNHFPPLYPLLLAGFQASGIGDLAGARWLGALLYGATVFLSGLAIYRISRSFWAAGLGALGIMISPIVIEVNLWALTEPLFITLTLLGALLLDSYLVKGKRRWLLLSALAVSLAYLTRYIGISAMLAFAAAILLQFSSPVRRRLADSALLVGFSIVPVAVWMLLNYLAIGSPTNRAFIFHSIVPRAIQQLRDTLTRMSRPLQDTFQIGRRKLVLIAATLAVFYLYPRNQARAGQPRPGPVQLSLILTLYCLSYMAILTTSLLFFDALTPLDDRILGPLYVPLFILLVASIPRLLKAASRISRALPGILLVLIVLVAVSFIQYNIGESQTEFTWSREQGLGLANRKLAETSIIKLLQELPEDYLIVSENLEKVYIFTERPAFHFPSKFDKVKQTPVEDYWETLDRIGEQIRTRKVALVLFTQPSGIQELIAERYPELELVCPCSNGLVYVNE